MKTMKVQTTLRLAPDLRKRLKLLAVHEETSMEALLAEAVKMLLDARKAKAA